jgi:calcium-dependent protein kinase
VKIYEFYEDDQRYYLVQELCTGGELFDQIYQQEEGFSEQKCASIIRQLLSAVLYLHNKGIMHRDIKPENILIDSKSNLSSSSNFLRLKGFYNAVQVKKGVDKIVTHDSSGTSYYVAPEVLMNEYHFASDVWSVGVILYILLTGQIPFNGQNDKQIVRKVRLGNLNFNIRELESVSSECRAFLKLLLTYDHERRLSAQEALMHPWLLEHLHDGEDEEEILNHVILAMNNLNNYKCVGKMQEAIIIFMVC